MPASSRQQRSLRTVSGLRTRYFPRFRVGQGLLSIGPWLDVVLLVIFFALLNSRFVLQPGVIVELPEAPFRNGSQSGLVVVVLSFRGPHHGGRQEVLFFEDERFPVGQEARMREFQTALAARAARAAEPHLIIQADRRVDHGTVVRLMNIAREAGIRNVNVAARPPAE